MFCSEILPLIQGRQVTENSNTEGIKKAFASDLMSDVLTVESDNLVLITGLASTQTIRTAIMADIKCILLVRDKKASAEMKALAEENNICIVETPFSMFKTCGILHSAGIESLF